MNDVVSKLYTFRNGVSGTFTVKSLLNIYNNTNKLHPQFLQLVYLSSTRFRDFVRENLPDYFASLNSDDEYYEDEVFNACGALTYDISQEGFGEPVISNFTENSVEQNLLDFLDIEMKMWITWSFNKYDGTKTPVHLMRYLIGNSII